MNNEEENNLDNALMKLHSLAEKYNCNFEDPMLRYGCLALHLAQKYAPEFKEECKKGRKADPVKPISLYLDVKLVMHRESLKQTPACEYLDNVRKYPFGVRDAFNRAQKQPAIKMIDHFIEKMGVEETHKQWSSALEKYGEYVR